MPASERSVEGDDLRLLKDADLGSLNIVIAFGGWPDAKRVATRAAEYLKDKLNAEKIGEIDPNALYNFAIQRPIVRIEQGLMRDYELPRNDLYAWKGTRASHDLLILIGVEPHISWPRYVESIFRVVDLEKTHRICLLGGLIDRIPHTIEPLVSGVATTLQLVEEMKIHGVEPTEYTGPSSIHSFILRESQRRGIPTMSLWGHAPEYIVDADSRTAHQLLSKVKAIMSIDVDLRDLEKEGEMLRRQLDMAMRENQAFSQLVQRLELDYKVSRRKPDYIK